MTGLQAISVDKARQIATKKGLKPARVRGTEKVQFTKGRNANVEPVAWEEFEGLLAKRHLGGRRYPLRRGVPPRALFPFPSLSSSRARETLRTARAAPLSH